MKKKGVRRLELNQLRKG